MKNIVKIVLLVSLMLVASLFLFTACGGDEGDLTEANTLIVSYPDDIGTLDPHNYDSPMWIQSLVYEGLTRYVDGEVVPAMAESWEISDDGTEYTFYLREGAVFSDGTPVNAEIVKKNLDAVLAYKADHNWMETMNQMEEITVVDEYTVKITFGKPFSGVLQELSFARPIRIGAEAMFPESGDTSEGISEPIGSGMWILKEHVEGQYAIFERNENYWGEKPEYQYLKVVVIPDINTAVNSLKAGEVDLIYDLEGQMTGDTYNELVDSGYSTVVSEPMTTLNLLVNTNKGNTQDLNVRLALEYGVDKQAIVDNVFYGLQEVADTIMPTSTPYCDIGLEAYTYNQEKAVSLLEESGWVLEEGAVYRTKDGEELIINFFFNSDNALDKTIGQILQSQYEQIGIKIVLTGQDSQTLITSEQEGLCDLSLCESWGAPFDPHSYLSSFRDVSHGDYAAQLGLSMKDEIDQAISDALNSTDEEMIQENYTYVLTTLHEQAVYVPLTYTTKVAAFSNEITGIRFNTSVDIPSNEFVIER